MAVVCQNYSGLYYGVSASGACPVSKSIAVYLPPGVPSANGTYTVTQVPPFPPAAGTAAVKMFDYTGGVQKVWTAQSGTVSVTANGSSVSVSFTGLPATNDKDATNSVLSGSLSCQ